MAWRALKAAQLLGKHKTQTDFEDDCVVGHKVWGVVDIHGAFAHIRELGRIVGHTVGARGW